MLLLVFEMVIFFIILKWSVGHLFLNICTSNINAADINASNINVNLTKLLGKLLQEFGVNQKSYNLDWNESNMLHQLIKS